MEVNHSNRLSLPVTQQHGLSDPRIKERKIQIQTRQDVFGDTMYQAKTARNGVPNIDQIFSSDYVGSSATRMRNSPSPLKEMEPSTLRQNPSNTMKTQYVLGRTPSSSIQQAIQLGQQNSLTSNIRIEDTGFSRLQANVQVKKLIKQKELFATGTVGQQQLEGITVPSAPMTTSVFNLDIMEVAPAKTGGVGAHAAPRKSPIFNTQHNTYRERSTGKSPSKSPRVGPYSQKGIEHQRIKAKNEIQFDDNGTFGLVPVTKVKEIAQMTGWKMEHDHRPRKLGANSPPTVHPVLTRNPLFERSDYRPSTKIGAHQFSAFKDKGSARKYMEFGDINNNNNDPGSQAKAPMFPSSYAGRSASTEHYNQSPDFINQEAHNLRNLNTLALKLGQERAKAENVHSRAFAHAEQKTQLGLKEASTYNNPCLLPILSPVSYRAQRGSGSTLIPNKKPSMFATRHKSVNVNQKLRNGKQGALTNGGGLPDVHRPKASQFGSPPAEGTEPQQSMFANGRQPGMSSTAHFKLLEQTLLNTSPEAGPGVAEDYDAENSRSSIILGEQNVLDQQDNTLSQSQSKTRIAANSPSHISRQFSGVASLSNIMSTFERANILDPVYNKHNKRFNLYGQYGKNYRQRGVNFMEMAEQYNEDRDIDAQSFTKIDSTNDLRAIPSELSLALSNQFGLLQSQEGTLPHQSSIQTMNNGSNTKHLRQTRSQVNPANQPQVAFEQGSAAQLQAQQSKQNFQFQSPTQREAYNRSQESTGAHDSQAALNKSGGIFANADRFRLDSTFVRPSAAKETFTGSPGKLLLGSPRSRALGLHYANPQTLYGPSRFAPTSSRLEQAVVVKESHQRKDLEELRIYQELATRDINGESSYYNSAKKKVKVLKTSIKRKAVELGLGLSGEQMRGVQDKVQQIIQLEHDDCLGVLRQRHLDHLQTYNRLRVSPVESALDGTEGTEEDQPARPPVVVRRADQFNIPEPAERTSGADGAGTSPAHSPTYSEAGQRLHHKASVDRMAVDTIEGRSNATKEAEHVDHQGCKTGAAEPRARYQLIGQLNQISHLASAASLVHEKEEIELEASPTTEHQAAAARRGAESVRTTEQIQAAGDQGRQAHTVARKYEAGNDDLSHLMRPPAGTSSPAKKKKLTLHAVSNTQPLRDDFLKEPSTARHKGELVKVLQHQDRQLNYKNNIKDTILLLDGDGAGEILQAEDDSALGTVQNHHAELADQEAQLRGHHRLSPELGRASPSAISVQLTQPITYARNSRLPLILQQYSHLQPGANHMSAIQSVIDREKRAELQRQRDREWEVKRQKLLKQRQTSTLVQNRFQSGLAFPELHEPPQFNSTLSSRYEFLAGQGPAPGGQHHHSPRPPPGRPLAHFAETSRNHQPSADFGLTPLRRKQAGAQLYATVRTDDASATKTHTAEQIIEQAGATKTTELGAGQRS